MGGSSSSTADANGAGACTEAKLLGNEILCGIISAQQGLAMNLESKSGSARTAQEKKIIKAIVLQQKFMDYRKLVVEVKDQNIEQLNSDLLKLKLDLESSKQEITKITTENQDLKKLSAKNIQDLNKAISELNRKRAFTESILTSEVDRLSFKLQNETKFKQKLKNKLYLGKQNAILFEEKIKKQTKLVFDLEERLNITQKDLDSEIAAKKELSYKFELELDKLKQEKENLTRDYLLQSTERDNEHSKIKITIEEQADQLKILNRTLKMKENKLQQQKTSKKKVQEELRAVNIKIIQLEAKIAKQQKAIIQTTTTKAETKSTEALNDLHTEEKQIKDLYETLYHVSKVDEQLTHFEAKTHKQTTKSNIKTENSKTDEENFKESEAEEKQVEELYETLCKLNMTQGKLFLLEENFKNIKKFCTKELQERNDFFKKSEKLRQQSKTDSGKFLGATKEKEDYFLKEKMDLERQLDQKTKEIALLKQHLKQKEMELQNAACAERSSSRRYELN